MAVVAPSFPALRLKEENLLLDCRLPISTLFLTLSPSTIKHTNWVVFEHAEWSVLARSDEGFVVAGQGHGHEAHRYGTGFG